MRIRNIFALSVLTFALATSPAFGFTENDIQEVFKGLDENGDGRVTREEYDGQKIFVIYRNVPVSNDALTDGDIAFGQTKLSRKFFDASDTDHNGKLSPIEVTDAFRFERIAPEGKSYFTIEDLRAVMKRIGN